MTMAGPVCSCDGPFAEMFSRCDVHGSRYIRDQIRNLEARLEAAEGERDDRDEMYELEVERRVAAQNEADNLRGERDRLREAGTRVEVVCGCKGREIIDEPCERHRAALSTGDRQETSFGGTGAVVLPESADGQDTATVLRQIRNELLAMRGTLTTQTMLAGRDEAMRLTEYERRCSRAAKWIDTLAERMKSVSGEGGEEG